MTLDACVGPTPYDSLVGTELVDGWIVTGRASQSAESTGGNFSVCFHVENAAGERAFCKVIDFKSVLESEDPMAAMLEMSGDFTHEVASLDLCKDAQMKRVVLALASGTSQAASLPMGLLSYIIFEPAEGDIRMVLPLTWDADDLPIRFALLHDAVLGVNELHRVDISHQDIKPSNVLAMGHRSIPRKVGKIADLGRATVATRPHRFDAYIFPGDMGYAPPEYWYQSVPSSNDDRRRGTDLYQLGSLIAFVLGGASMPALVRNALEPSLQPNAWAGPYDDIEPLLPEATAAAIDAVVRDTPDWASQIVRELLAALCDPDFSSRNAITSGAVHVSRFDLQRVISALDRLHKLATVKARSAV